jgi:hypothetical protein
MLLQKGKHDKTCLETLGMAMLRCSRPRATRQDKLLREIDSTAIPPALLANK